MKRKLTFLTCVICCGLLSACSGKSTESGEVVEVQEQVIDPEIDKPVEKDNFYDIELDESTHVYVKESDKYKLSTSGPSIDSIGCFSLIDSQGSTYAFYYDDAKSLERFKNGYVRSTLELFSSVLEDKEYEKAMQTIDKNLPIVEHNGFTANEFVTNAKKGESVLLPIYVRQVRPIGNNALYLLCASDFENTMTGLNEFAKDTKYDASKIPTVDVDPTENADDVLSLICYALPENGQIITPNTAIATPEYMRVLSDNNGYALSHYTLTPKVKGNVTSLEYVAEDGTKYTYPVAYYDSNAKISYLYRYVSKTGTEYTINYDGQVGAGKIGPYSNNYVYVINGKVDAHEYDEVVTIELDSTDHELGEVEYVEHTMKDLPKVELIPLGIYEEGASLSDKIANSEDEDKILD